MKTITVRAYPFTSGKTCFLDSPQAHMYVHSAPGHNAVVVECSRPYRKTKNSKKLVNHGMRMELNGVQALELIEALAKSLNDVSAGVCR